MLARSTPRATNLRVAQIFSQPARHFSRSPRRLDIPPNKPPVTSNYKAPAAPKSRTTGSQLPVIPLVAIFCLGSASFYWIVKSREGSGFSHYVLPERAPPKQQWPRSPQDESPK